MATNSFGLGRPFYKSSHQLPNFGHHGNQNGHNLEGCHPCPDIPKVPPSPILLRASGMLILRTSKQITKAQTNHCCYLPLTFFTRPDWLFPCTVEPQYNEGWRDQQNLFTLTRFRYIKVLFHKFYYYWGKENCSL